MRCFYCCELLHVVVKALKQPFLQATQSELCAFDSATDVPLSAIATTTTTDTRTTAPPIARRVPRVYCSERTSMTHYKDHAVPKIVKNTIFPFFLLLSLFSYLAISAFVITRAL